MLVVIDTGERGSVNRNASVTSIEIVERNNCGFSDDADTMISIDYFVFSIASTARQNYQYC